MSLLKKDVTLQSKHLVEGDITKFMARAGNVDVKVKERFKKEIMDSLLSDIPMDWDDVENQK